MNKLINVMVLTSLTLLIGTTTNVANASKFDKKASEEYSKEMDSNGTNKLLGKKWEYAVYKFKLTKKTNFYKLYWSKKATAYNKIIGKVSLPKGTVVIGQYSGTSGSIWNIYDHKVKLPKQVSLTAVLTNKNAKPINGNYNSIKEQSQKEIYSK